MRGLQHYGLRLCSSKNTSSAAVVLLMLLRCIVDSVNVSKQGLFAGQLLHSAVRASTKEGRMTIAVLRVYSELNLEIVLDATDHPANATRLASMVQMSLTGQAHVPAGCLSLLMNVWKLAPLTKRLEM